MALVIIAGIDRTGKSTVAKYYESKGYELIHMSAPPKGQSSEEFLQEMVDLVSGAAMKDIVLDRSYMGELIWPQVYGRPSLLTDEGIETLREIEDAVGVTRIMMHDPNVEAHWKRCVENKEPLTKAQFVKARSLYTGMAKQYGFEMVTLPMFLKKFPEAQPNQDLEKDPIMEITIEATPSKIDADVKTPEQHKLDQANAINDILEKRVLKQKGLLYDELELEIRQFLNSKLGKIFGATSNNDFTPDEIHFFKTMFRRATEKK